MARAIGREIVRVLGYHPTKPTDRLSLSFDFPLSDERPRTLRRIPHRLNYPPVVSYLVEKAFDAESGHLRKPKFTFGDVREAIEATDVNLSWARADTFVADIARSRNVLQIIEPCAAKGYSIRATGGGGYIGEFVPLGEPGTVEDKDASAVRSRDLVGAIRVTTLISFEARRLETVSEALHDPVILQNVWPRRKVRIQVSTLEARNGSGFVADYRLVDGRGSAGRGLLIVTHPKALPPRSRIARMAKDAGVAEVVVLSAVTSRHLLVLRFDNCPTAPKEVGRKVFEVVAQG